MCIVMMLGSGGCLLRFQKKAMIFFLLKTSTIIGIGVKNNRCQAEVADMITVLSARCSDPSVCAGSLRKCVRRWRVFARE